MKSGIYIIENLVNDKIYIGSAVNLNKRFNSHRTKLYRNIHDNKYLQASWNKHSKDNFYFGILEYCESDKLIEREQWWLDFTKDLNKYNLVKNAGNTLGLVHSEDSKAKMSVARKGIIKSPEWQAKINASLKSKKPSEETKSKISKAHKGKHMPEHVKEILFKAKRKSFRWPHELGHKCRCDECKEKWKSYRVGYYHSRIKYKIKEKDVNISAYICGQM